jgi:hypothetical protein
VAIALEVRTDRRIELADLVARIERVLDSRDDETLLALAPDLAALANHPTFLGEHIARELASPETFQRGTAYTGRSFVLARGTKFLIRANLWDPEGGDPWGERESAELRRQIGMYGLLHDHDFSFITVGYFGPGYETVLYECDPERIEGYIGEKVALERLGTRVLTPGSLLYFCRRRHVHEQGTPVAPSISLNVIALDPETPFVSQYYFDDRSHRIVAMTSDPFNGRLLLCDLAAALGVARAEGALAAIARTHRSPGLRAQATRALAALAGEDGGAVWRGALADPHPLVRRRAREALEGGR